ncbi:MAG: chitobiase/beta-hexosaminidase C-terminal domain-containing protein, partial [Muribaculaceae bacterium]|nr:chitobiase/beta-hexosaminidase C-terminal domain-containing protein [Muribaculaceae bacterium]
MKKLLLTLAASAMTLFASAANVTDVLTVESLKSNAGFSASSTTYADYTVEGESGAVYAFQCAHNKGTCIQLRSTNNAGIVVTKSPGKVESVTLTWASNTADARSIQVYSADTAYTSTANLYAPDKAGTLVGTIGKTDSIQTLTLPTPAPFAGIRSASGALYLEKIEIVWQTDGSVPTVARPVITCADNKVTITATDADAIYYTLDGSAPTTASTKYTEPFAINASVTVKAIAAKGDATSLVTTYDAVYVGSYPDFAAFIAANTTGTVAGPISVLYQSADKRYLYLKDSKGGYMLSFGALDEVLVNGDVLASITGRYAPYNKLPEMVPSEIGDKTTGSPVAPEELAVEELSVDMANAYIVLKDVTITNVSGKNFSITDATGTVTGYNTLSIAEIPEGTGFTLEGFVSRYNNNLQITPVAITGGKVMETVATPVFSAEDGAVTAGTAVTITTATEGATIYYTLDGTAPTSASTKYTEPIVVNKAVTIKAIAAKEGMFDSEVASVTYTVTDPNAETATFDFTDVTKLTPAVEKPENGKGTSVAGMTFTADGVTMAVSEAATSNPPRIWAATGAQAGSLDFRMYVGDYFTLTAPAGKAISSVAFTKDGGSFAMTPPPGTLSASGTNATWIPAGEETVTT